MAGQQFVFAEAIIGMKKAVARYDASDEDDSAAEIARSVQHKLKRKAPRNQSILDNGRFIYKKPKIEHAGYRRHIIARNPPLIDEDGDEIEEVDDDESVDGSVAEDNPYGDIRLEELLAPLTSAADLATHPSMSIPYYSNHITELVNNSREVLQREEKSLWRAKAIMQKLLGDNTWLAVGEMETSYDREILSEPASGVAASTSTGSLEADSAERQGTSWEDPVKISEGTNMQGTPQAISEQQAQDADVQMENGADAQTAPSTNGDSTHHAELRRNAPSNGTNLNPKTDALVQTQQQEGTRQEGAEAERQTNGDMLKHEDQSASAGSSGDKMQVDGTNGTAEDGANEPRSPHSDDAEDTNSQHTSHRMTTRAQRRANSHTSSVPGSPRTLSPESPGEPPIHPLFKFPVENLVDRDMGLPASEAEDTRTWLLMYIQKQEEVVRQTRALYMGLMQADRKRKMVLKWAKAEGHVGEMSDGEDWVDKEEWGLTEDLVKGKEEEEEEGVAQAKKTRARRREEK
ncbi:hypothetical protein SLS56_007817 [Neofusicoccum ribis]|uniref:Transcriptional regulatory protein RXT2 N-terminal domain-containing protein n=1 Tax=Neofusicoccum ribis TaxID=45134 RepID=A0ABR3SLY3_9PEZI